MSQDPLKFAQSQLAQKRLELINYIANGALKYLDSLYDRTPIWKRYSEGRHTIHVHLVGTTDDSRFCVTCWRNTFDLVDFFLYDNKPSVFVEVGETAKVLEPVPSIVRLKLLEHCNMFIADAFEIGVPPSREALWRVFNRELNVAADMARIMLRDRTSHIVEGASEAVGTFADPDAYTDNNDIERIVGGINIQISGNDPIVLISNPFLKPRQVFSAPTDHGVDFIKFCYHTANL